LLISCKRILRMLRDGGYGISFEIDSKCVILLQVLKAKIDAFVNVVDVLLGDVDIAERDRLR
jgi:hypothetical protein